MKKHEKFFFIFAIIIIAAIKYKLKPQLKLG